MKRIILAFVLTSMLWNCKSISNQTTKEQVIQATINLTEVKNDQVLVTVNAPRVTTEAIIYRIPKTVPGTYTEDNYGRYIEDLKAFDKKGNLLEVKKLDENS